MTPFRTSRLSSGAALLALLALAPVPVGGEEARWPSFRGPRARGVAPGEAPTRWNAETGEGVAWKRAIPGLAHSSPIVWDDRLYVTTVVGERGAGEMRAGLYGDIRPVEDEGVQSWRLYALDRSTGEVVWARTAVDGVPEIRRHPKATHANPTPATDGEHVVAFFGSEGLFVYDRQGELLWKKDFGVLDAGFFQVPEAQWGFASSPVIHQGLVVVQADVQGGGFVAALRLEDGEEVWRTPRDDVPTWSSPTVHEVGGRAQVLVNGYRHLGAYDLATGKEVWRLHGGGDIPVPTPFAAHGLVFFTSSHGGSSPIYAVREDARGRLETRQGDGEEAPAIAWSRGRDGAYMPTPVVYGEILYVLQDNGVLSAYDALTGERHYQERLGRGGAFTASLVAADGKLYATSEEGEVFVVRAGRSYQELARNRLGELTLATPAIAGGELYFRTRGHLVAVEGVEGETAGAS